MSKDYKTPVFDIEANAGEDFDIQMQLFDGDLTIQSIDATSPIVVHCLYHGKATGDAVVIFNAKTDDGRDSNANCSAGIITVIDQHSFSLNATTTNGATIRSNGAMMATPRDCTGGTLKCEIREDPNAAIVVKEIALSFDDITTGQFTPSILGADLQSLADEYDHLAYDIFYTDSSGKAWREVRGDFNIALSVTKFE